MVWENKPAIEIRNAYSEFCVGATSTNYSDIELEEIALSCEEFAGSCRKILQIRKEKREGKW
jgi:hypothetical protein